MHTSLGLHFLILDDGSENGFHGELVSEKQTVQSHLLEPADFQRPFIQTVHLPHLPSSNPEKKTETPALLLLKSEFWRCF